MGLAQCVRLLTFIPADRVHFLAKLLFLVELVGLIIVHACKIMDSWYLSIRELVLD